MKKQVGFSLMELMIVVAIVGILAAFAYPSYLEQMRQTRRADCSGALASLGSAMERFFTRHGVSLTTGMEMASNEAIKQAVEAGLGLGIVSIHTLALELGAGHLVVLDVEGFPILRHWYVVHRKGKRLAPVAEAFRQFVLSEAKNILHGTP